MKRSENILLLGLGGVGHYVAQRLSTGGHHVTVIERDPERLGRSDSEIDARFIKGDVLDVGCWRTAGAEKMDYVIAVTDDDAANIVASRIAESFGIPQKIARIRSFDVWSEDAPVSAEDLHIDLVIRPEELAAQEIARVLRTRAGNMLVDVGDGHHQVLALHIKEGSPLEGRIIRDLSKQYRGFDFQIVCVARDIETLLPGGNFLIQRGDHVFIMASCDDMPHLMERAWIDGGSDKHRVLIVGGGLIGGRVAELLQHEMPVRLVELSEDLAEELSHRLPGTEVLHGDGSHRDVLLGAGLFRMDTLVTASGDNETNILTCLLAKHMARTSEEPSEVTTIALVKRVEYMVLASAVGTDIAVNKKVLAANAILRYIRRGSVLSVAHLHGCDGEVVELIAGPNAPITRRALHSIPELHGVIRIGCVFRGGSWQLATGATTLQPGDRAVCVCRAGNLPDLQNLFL